ARVFNLAWIKQSIPLDWAKIVTVSSAVVAGVAIGVLLYTQWQTELRRFAINRDTFVDHEASVNVRMISLAQMCEMRPAASRTEFHQLTGDEQLSLFREANLNVIGERFFVITDCLQDEAARMNAPLQEIVHEKVEGWCRYHQTEPPHPRCTMKPKLHD
ncbi:MAG: hypothetical protein KDE58_24740, partial [Caldilineaceae bacterium]|nr:hypothetical protein [Caldilineaceae bacterium]